MMTKQQKPTNSKPVAGLLLLLICVALSSSAQLIEQPIPHTTHSARRNASAKSQAIQTVNLPFWDDFSYTDTLTYPDESRWLYGKSVLLNSGSGIRPPSKNVVTLDGSDSVGMPYNVNDVLAKGFADKMTSMPIRMDLVNVLERSTVYLSFYYQLKGRGESPDPGDQLLVNFKANDGKWENAFTIENDGTQDPSTFYQILIPITDSKFFHDSFQFSLQNSARLSGPYDTWHVDYIYLNKGRSSVDDSYPDRTVSEVPGSLFTDYHSIPIRHFLLNPAGLLKKPTLTLYNLRSGNTQPFDYTTSARISSRVAGVTTTTDVPLDITQDPGQLLNGLQYFNLALNTIPASADFDPLADSVAIELAYGMTTRDNLPIGSGGDYDPAIFDPIEFRVNDSTRTRYLLTDYYAYDDGHAEYGAGLNQAGAFLAVKYSLKEVPGDTVVYIDIYFPEFSDHSSQSLTLQIRSQLDDLTSSVLHQETIQVDRTTGNKFTRYKLLEPITVGPEFYVVWKQLNNVSIPVGLDKNTDNGDKIYYNTNGSWVQNVLVQGSLMVRPGFGPGKSSGVVTGVERSSAVVHAWPNPSEGRFYLDIQAEDILLRDIHGRPLGFSQRRDVDKTEIDLTQSHQGLVIVQYRIGTTTRYEKVLIK